MKTVDVLGVPVAATDYQGAVEWCLERGHNPKRAYAVEAANTHVLALARSEPSFGEVIRKFDLVVPDGVPLVWAINRQSEPSERLHDRVYGPTLMLEVLKATRGRAGHSHFLLGGSEATLAKLETNLAERFPGVDVAATYSPPFGEWPDDEFERIRGKIIESGASYVWVGLGCPKQERWIADHLEELSPALYFGVGAAFAFHAGEVRQAPGILQGAGLEWLFRLCMEPSRLWRRYLVYNSLFLYHVAVSGWSGQRGEQPERPPSSTSVAFREESHDEPPSLEISEDGVASHLVPRVDVLGVGVSELNLEQASDLLIDFVGSDAGSSGYVCVTGVHGVIEAQDDPGFMEILNRSLLCTPDGVPLVWVGRFYGRKISRVYGPDLMLEIFRKTEGTGIRHFFYGGNDGVAELLKEKLQQQFPDTEVCGTYTPPFRPLNPEEEIEFLELLEQSQPDILWVGLSTPKQERFMAEWVDRVPARLLLGVGAAFDFHTGLVTQAPRWVQENGLEWLFRLLQEPRRLWPRYSRINPRFMWRILSQLFRGNPPTDKSS